MESILDVQELRKSFTLGLFGKKTEVLKGISFNVKKGSITGFLGANGAGKTTTLKCLLNLIFPNSGKVSFFGTESFNKEVKSRIGFLPERPYFYAYLTGMEFLKFYGELSGKLSGPRLKERSDSLLKKVDLWHAKDKPLRGYSKGMLQKIGFAQALIHEPEFVILDEPMSGLDPDGRYYLSELIRETAKEGKTVFFSSHLLKDTEELCNELVVLRKGEVFYNGPTSEVLKSLNNKFNISYFQNGKNEKVVINGLESVQKEIQSLMSKGCSIEKVDPQRRTLEEFFVHDVLREGK